MKNYIFGAKATAAGFYKALSLSEPENKIDAFLVSDIKENVSEIWSCPVINLEEADKDSHIYVAVPELIHDEVVQLLQDKGFDDIELIDSRKEASIMEKYYEKLGIFPSIHSLPLALKDKYNPKITVYAAVFYKDRPLKNPPVFPEYIKKLYLGCDGAVKAGIDIFGKADFFDNTGDNISSKNPNRCEMTAHYWVWKNRIDDEYVGICHYRRMLDLSDDDLMKIKENDVDVVLPFPMIHYPDAEIQHSWYVPEKDWLTMKNVIKELYPEYYAKFDEIFKKPYFYNYNMLIAKKNVFADYCEWLYPILDRIEETSKPKGCDRHDRYTAYMSESLETLYFMANFNHLKIFYTGRLLFK